MTSIVLQKLGTFSFMILASLVVIFETVNGNCDQVLTLCNPLDSSRSPPPLAAVVIYLPVLNLLIQDIHRMEFLCMYFLASITIIISAGYLQSSLALVTALSLLIPSACISYQVHNERVNFFYSQREALLAQEKSFDARVRDSDKHSRTMAANVAHDLKTVSTTITTFLYMIFIYFQLINK